MKLIKSYFLNFKSITSRLLKLLFRNKNRPSAEVLDINDLSKGSVSYLSIKLRVTNLLFLRIDRNVFPVYHDDVQLSISIPLTPGQSQIKVYGLGAFKRTKTYKFSIADARIFKLKEGAYSDNGNFEGVILSNNTMSILPINPDLQKSNPVVSNIQLHLNFSEVEIEIEQPKLKYDWHELNLELNKNL